MIRAVLLAFLLAHPAVAAIARVQAKSGHAVASSSISMVLTPTSSLTAGNTAVVAIHYGRCPGCTVPHSILTVVDTGGSAYAQRAGPIQSAANQRTEVWSTGVGGVLASSTITITLAGDVNSTFLSAEVEELSGVLALGNTNTATSTSATASVAVTSQNANNWVLAGMYNDAAVGTFTSVSGTIRASDDGGAGAITGDSVIMDIGPAAGSQTLSWSDASSDWQAAGLEVCAQTPCSGSAVGPTNSGMLDFWGCVRAARGMDMDDRRARA